MLPVMFITDFCDFGRAHPRRPQRSAQQVTEGGEGRTVIWWSKLLDHRVFTRIQRSRDLKVLLLCWALQLVGCVRKQQPSPEIVAEINTLEQRTIAPNCSLQNASRITKHPASVQANWQIRNLSTAKIYFDWVKQQLGTDYQVLSETESVLAMGKRLPGDSYTVEFTNKRSESTIDVRFQATSD
jgi:hypothetical protein